VPRLHINHKVYVNNVHRTSGEQQQEKRLYMFNHHFYCCHSWPQKGS